MDITASFIAILLAGLAGVWKLYEIGKSLAELRSLLAPMLRRRRAVIAVLGPASDERDRFVASLRGRGFARARAETMGLPVEESTILVMWRPDADAVRRAQAHVHTHPILVYSTERLDIRLDGETLVSNSTVRLLGDLAVVVEGD